MAQLEVLAVVQEGDGGRLLLLGDVEALEAHLKKEETTSAPPQQVRTMVPQPPGGSTLVYPGIVSGVSFHWSLHQDMSVTSIYRFHTHKQ